MTKEDKQLLLQDLIARIPYGVKFLCGNNIYDAKGIDLLPTDEGEWEYHITSWNMAPVELKYIKPYLRPMSSMTEEEKKEFDNFCVIDEFVWKGNAEIGYKNQAIIMSHATDWLNKKMFDYRGLIEKDAAIAVTKENNPF